MTYNMLLGTLNPIHLLTHQMKAESNNTSSSHRQQLTVIMTFTFAVVQVKASVC